MRKGSATAAARANPIAKKRGQLMSAFTEVVATAHRPMPIRIRSCASGLLTTHA